MSEIESLDVDCPWGQIKSNQKLVFKMFTTFELSATYLPDVLACYSRCLVSKELMPCPFTGPKIFCAGPNFLRQPKNLTAFSASTKTFVSTQKPILLNANHLFVWHKMFVTATICE